jgi:hypothetical protein
LEMVKRGLKRLVAASVEIGVSYRQAERIYKRYLEGGDDALVHGNKGRLSKQTGAAQTVWRVGWCNLTGARMTGLKGGDPGAVL